MRPSSATPERERDMRMLSMLVRTLRELSAFDAGVAPGDGSAAAAEEAPRDIDALREDLARRLNNLMDDLAAKRADATDGQGAVEEAG